MVNFVISSSFFKYYLFDTSYLVYGLNKSDDVSSEDYSLKENLGTNKDFF